MAITSLKKWSATALKAYSAADNKQIPAGSATLNVYRQGASVSGGVTIAGNGGFAFVSVYNTGALQVNDSLKLNTLASSNLTVTELTDAVTIGVRNDGPDDIAIQQYDRLVITSRRPKLYRESTGTAVVPGGGISGKITLDAQGGATFYSSVNVFDYIVSGTGITTTLVKDEESGAFTPDWVNVTNYATFQEAIDALPAQGGTVYVPAGYYDRTTVPAVVPMTISKRVHLLGSTPAQIAQDGGTFLSYRTHATEDLSSNLITISGHSADFTLIENIGFEGADSAGSGVGVFFEAVSDLTIRNCFFQSFPSWCMKTGDGVDIVNCVFEHVGFSGSRSNGLVQLSRGTGLNFYHKFDKCNFQNNLGYGVDMGSSEFIIFDSCVFQSSQADGANQEMINLAPGTTATIFKTIIRNCWLEHLNGAVNPTCYLIRMVGNTIGTVIDGNIFSRTATGTTHLKAVLLENQAAPNATLAPKGTMISNNLGDLGIINTTAGTDDISISTNSGSTVLMNNLLSDNADYGGFMRVSGMKSADVRLAESLRTKVPSAANQAQLDAIPDLIRGDMVFNNANNILNFVDAAGVWRQAGTYVWTGGAGDPTSGKFSIGDTIYNTTDFKIYICTTAGTAGAGAVFKKTVALT